MKGVLSYCAFMLALLDLTIVIKTVQKYTPLGAEDSLERFISRASVEDIDKAERHAISFTLMVTVAQIMSMMP